MKVYLSHYTAFKCIRELRTSPLFNDSFSKFDLREDRTSLEKKQLSSNTVISSLKWPFYNVKQDASHLDILITNEMLRISTKCNKNLCYHICNANLPRNLFVQVTDDVIVSGPELVFVQLAEILDFPSLVLAGLELCGTYVVIKNPSIDFTSGEKGFVDNCLPATSVEKIEHLLKLMKKRKSSGYLKHIAIAREAIKCIGNFSGSPRESQIFALLHGPRKYGMYGIADLIMNKEFDFAGEEIQVAGQSSAKVDICSPRAKVALEYDSRMFHENFSQNQRDKRRADALTMKGWTVLNVVPDQLESSDTFDAIAQTFLYALTKRSTIRNKKFYENKNSTFNKLIHADTENLC